MLHTGPYALAIAVGMGNTKAGVNKNGQKNTKRIIRHTQYGNHSKYPSEEPKGICIFNDRTIVNNDEVKSKNTIAAHIRTHKWS